MILLGHAGRRYPLELMRGLIEHYSFQRHHALTRREGITKVDGMLLNNIAGFVSQRYCAFELARSWSEKLTVQLAEDKVDAKPKLFPASGSLTTVVLHCGDLSSIVAGCGESMVKRLKVSINVLFHSLPMLGPRLPLLPQTDAGTLHRPPTAGVRLRVWLRVWLRCR